jgi:hypothetical protein
VLFVVVQSVVGLGLVGPGLAEDLAAKGVSKERFDVGRVGGHHEIQQVRSAAVVGDEVRGAVADAEIEDLDMPGPFPSGYLAGAFGDLLGVSGAGHEDADRSVEDLVHAVEHQILVVRSQHGGCDFVAAAKH